jgi:two-component system nitrogen regulation response regulator GlnG
MHQGGAPAEADHVRPEILGQGGVDAGRVPRHRPPCAESHATVLINGESGTGKELVARALHRHSPRKRSALHRDQHRGHSARPARIRTVRPRARRLHRRYRDNDAAASNRPTAARSSSTKSATCRPELQTRLLRVLSDGHFYRVGGHSPIKSNVRVIAATHQNLEDRVKQGLFREDLFHRLNVIRLRIPPLRERREDIVLLAQHFMTKSAQELGVDAKRLSEPAMRYLQGLDFPGNVRQLENLCHWLTVMAPGQTVDVKDLPAELREGPDSARRDLPANWNAALATEADRLLSSAPGEVFEQLTRQFEATLIRRALNATGGRRIEAAHLLGIGRNTITRKIQELGLDDIKGDSEAA